MQNQGLQLKAVPEERVHIVFKAELKLNPMDILYCHRVEHTVS